MFGSAFYVGLADTSPIEFVTPQKNLNLVFNLPVCPLLNCSVHADTQCQALIHRNTEDNRYVFFSPRRKNAVLLLLRSTIQTNNGNYYFSFLNDNQHNNNDNINRQLSPFQLPLTKPVYFFLHFSCILNN